MILVFDSNKIHVQVICGTKEEYKPSPKVDEIQVLVDSLRQELSKFKKEVVEPKLKEIEQRVKEINDSQHKQITEAE